ncbi:MAG: glycosyltransferase family 4 protein [Ruminococcaceae bacterium]|nr:glycosyltransferase family 4 protein [Oscillospiraceae bacterium]
MRVAIFCEYFYPFISGVVTHIDTLRQGLEAEGHEVLIVTLDPKAKRHYIKDRVLYCPAIPLKKIYGYGVANPVNLKRLKIVKAFKPDIIHFHTEFSMGIFAMFAAQRLKLPSVYTLHTMYDDYLFYIFRYGTERVARPAAHRILRNLAARVTKIIGPSQKVEAYMRRCGVTQEINIIPNTVDLTDFMTANVPQEDVQAVRKQLGITPDDVTFCFVGRLGKEKSIDVLIDYFAANFAKEERFKLFVIGDGPEKEQLAYQIEHLGLEKQIKLLGRIEHEDLPAYYQAFSLFATASLTEMNSISMLEATASGLYVLQRLDIYNRDQIVSGVNGDVFTTPAEFGDIVRGYAGKTPEERQALRKSVSAYAALYGPKEFTEKVLDVYQRAIETYKHNPKGLPKHGADKPASHKKGKK